MTHIRLRTPGRDKRQGQHGPRSQSQKQLLCPNTTCAPHFFLFDQLKAIHDTFDDGRLGSGRLGSRCRESMQLTLHEVGEEHICAIAGNEEVEEAETVGVP